MKSNSFKRSMDKIPIDIWLCDPLEGDFTIQYAASFSPMLRLCLSSIQRKSKSHIAKSRIKEQIEGIVEYFEKNGEQLGLKAPPVGGSKGDKWLRQIDLRTGEGCVILKTFTGWEHSKKRWRVLVEGADEQHWEKEFISSEVN